MIINYSPFFDKEHFIDFDRRRKCIFNERVVGNAGLLTELELRGGLTCSCLSKIEREANYYHAVKKAINSHPGCFIEDSFKVDEYGVASELLKWRDELILAGWKPEIKNIPGKLAFIAEIEMLLRKDKINIRGNSDRWRMLIESKRIPLEDDDEIIIHFPRKYLPPFIGELLDKLEKDGIKCSYLEYDKCIANEGTNLHKIQKAILSGKAEALNPPEKKDSSFKILRFSRYLSALEWIASRDFPKESVFINTDNRNYDYYRMLFSKPVSGSSLSNANPEIVQLFKLGCSLFVRPLNIYNLLSYLQINWHPVPSALRRSLIDVIINEGGIVNDKWNEAIEKFFAEAGEKKSSEKQKIMEFLPLGMGSTNSISLKVLKNYVTELRSWATKKLIIISEDKKNPPEDLILKQFSELISLCNAFMIILTGQAGETISGDALKSWILSIYQPADYPNKEPEAGSHMVINSTAAFADPSKKTIWIDCFNGTPEPTMYKFLNAVEYDELSRRGLKLWSEELQVRTKLQEYKMALLNTSSDFIMIVSEKDMGERLDVHPLLVQLSSQFTDIDKVTTNNPEPECETIAVNHDSLPEAFEVLDIGQNNLFIPRKQESQSSLTTLIQNPLDYVLRYQAGLSGSSVIEISKENRTKGNVAHLFIEELVKDSGKDLQAMKRLMEKNFPERLEKAILQKGAILLLAENRIMLTEFSWQLEKSVDNLLRILEINGLKVEGCEIVRECRYNDELSLEARIDMLLKNEKGSYVIIDMKWTTSKTYYNRLIKENKALQLEVYREVLKRSEPGIQVSVVAYYNLSHGILETADELQGVNIITQDEPKDIFSQAMNSYVYRWNQLNAGIIEMAEKLPLDNLEYFNDTEKHDLYPLEYDSQIKTLKKTNDFSDFKTFKGGLL